MTVQKLQAKRLQEMIRDLRPAAITEEQENQQRLSEMTAELKEDIKEASEELIKGKKELGDQGNISSAAETELGGLFYNGKEATLKELGHKQPPTPIVTDNSTAAGIANDCVKQKRSKAMDMRFYWIRDRVRQGQYLVYWLRGSTNRADYSTNHHHPKHHVAMRPAFPLHPNHDNYYSCLDDDGPPQAPSKASPASGEGVLKARARATHMPRGPARRSVRPARSAE